MNKKVLLTVLQYIIFLGLGVAIILYMSGKLSDEQKADMMGAIKSVRLWLLAPIFLIGFLSHYFRALRWKLLLEQVHVKASTTNTTLAVLIGYITNLVLPRAGEVAKCTILARYEKVPADKMIGTIVAERAFDMVCLILITIAAFVFQASYIGDYAEDLFGPMSSKVKGVAATIYFQVFLVVGFVFLIAFFLFLKRIRQTKVGQFIKGLGDGIKSIFKLKKRGMFLLYTV
ncbi:MAG: flippase-like domain-containing protein, partial [Taibaiella sp.]|nr:flippase-like domain-containing protein [Taibaiella sp.]